LRSNRHTWELTYGKKKRGKTVGGQRSNVMVVIVRRKKNPGKKNQQKQAGGGTKWNPVGWVNKAKQAIIKKVDTELNCMGTVREAEIIHAV